MNEKDKYLNIYSGEHARIYETQDIPCKLGGGYGRICWGEGMLELMKDWNVQSLLDVGCGYGSFCDAATLFVPRVYGLDIASVATGKVIDNSDITFMDGEAKDLPLPDKSVEWITSFDCLEHCLEEDIDQILSEFNRVAVKGFVLSISYEPCEFEGVPLHMTVKPESWWMDKLGAYGNITKVGSAPITGIPYLVCRKPIEKKIVCYCSGGLSQRLQSIAQCESIAKETSRKLSIVWSNRDPLCPVKFDDLFSNPVDILSENKFRALTSCKIYAYVKDVAGQALVSGDTALREAVCKWGSTGIDQLMVEDEVDNIIIFHGDGVSDGDVSINHRFLCRLEPASGLKDRITVLISDLGINRELMGVHARGTDFGISIESYRQLMDKALERNPNLRFLVCSDELRYEEQLAQVFKDKVILRPRSHWVSKKDNHKGWGLGNLRFSKAAILDSLVDIYLLAHTDFKIYHESSSFAQLSKLLSESLDSVKIRKTDVGTKQVKNEPPAQRSPASTHFGNACITPRIYYFCPDTNESSAGIRRLYRHVRILREAGFEASILHRKHGFERKDLPQVPITYLDQLGPDQNAIFIIPEGMPKIMHYLSGHPGRRFVISLSWHYVFSTLPDQLDWRQFNIERVMVVSPVIGQMVSWSMGLPVHELGSSINHQQYYYDPELKRTQVAYIKRKAVNIDRLKRLLSARNPAFTHQVKWIGMEGVSEKEYADKIRKSSIFLNISMAEGFPTSCLEAMAAGAIVAGFSSVGGRPFLNGSGPDQNCILSPDGDYVTLAYALEPVLIDLIQGRMNNWSHIVSNARKSAQQITPEGEKTSLVAFWRNICRVTGTQKATAETGMAARQPGTDIGSVPYTPNGNLENNGHLSI